jgi:hypothetical protein
VQSSLNRASFIARFRLSPVPLPPFSRVEVGFKVKGKAIVGLRPIVLGTGTPHGTPGQVWRTWGTRPVMWSTCAFVADSPKKVEVRGDMGPM